MTDITQEEIEASPEVQAAMRKVARERALKAANDRLGGRKHGETANLRKSATTINALLCDYDLLAEPPPLAGSLATTYDMIVERLHAIADEIDAKAKK